MKRSGNIGNSDGGDGLPPSHRSSSRYAKPTPSTQTTEAQPPTAPREQDSKTNGKTASKEKQNVLMLAPETEDPTKQNKTVQEHQKGVWLAEPTAAPQVHHQRQRRGPRPLLPQDSVSVAPTVNEGEQSLPGAHHVSEGIGGDGEQDQERRASDVDTFAGNTQVIQAERVSEDADELRETQHQLRQLQQQMDEVNRRLQNGQTLYSQPVLATVVVPDGGGVEENTGPLQPAEGNTTDARGRITATNDDSKDTSSQRPSSRRAKLLIIFAAGIIAAVVAFMLAFFGPWNKDRSPNGTSMPSKSPTTMLTKAPTMPPTLSPTGTPTIQPAATLQPTTKLQNIASIVGVENLDSLSTASPEYQALEWMAYEDPLRDELLVLVTTSEGSNRILSERYSIVVLYYATNGISWDKQFNFLSGTSVCNWNSGMPSSDIDVEGIYCNGEGTVVDIDFHFNKLSGTIPSQLGELLSLKLLSLFGDDLRGTIPNALGALTQLKYLHFGENELTGTIPFALGALTQLTYLNVGGNELTGTIPEALSELKKLRGLSIYTNQLTGTVPLAFQSLTALEALYLLDTLLTGNLDPIFCPRSTTLWVLHADCAEPDPEITCSCCTDCW